MADYIPESETPNESNSSSALSTDSSSSSSLGSSSSPDTGVVSTLFEKGTITWKKVNGKIILNMGTEDSNDIVYEHGMSNDVKAKIVEKLKAQQVTAKEAENNNDDEVAASRGGNGTKKRKQNRQNKTKRHKY